MNLFKIYLSQIKKILIKNNKDIGCNLKEVLDNIVVENPPEKFNFDLSSNVAMVIAKNTKTNPRDIAEKIKEILIKEIKDFSEIEIAGPGFLNFNLSSHAWNNFIKTTLINNKKFDHPLTKKFNIEFVSANPTGPMHVGHCRGAVFGDVLSNLLKFSGHKVIKEYYINDYGKQIEDFTRSVFFRLREIKFKEDFPVNKNLYPGDYIKDIATKILKKNRKINLTNEKKIFNF